MPQGVVPQRTVIQRFVLVGMVVPVILAVAAGVLVWSWRAQLPDPVATHWGPGGVDGFSSLRSVLWAVPLATGGVSLVMSASAFPFLRRGGRGFTVRFLGATATWMAAFLGVLVVWSLAIQRGMPDAAAAPNLDLGMGVALVAGTVLGVLAWLVQPAQEANPAARSAGTAIAVAPGERVAWVRTASMSRGVMALLGGVTAALVALGLVFLAQGESVAGWITLGSAVLVGGLLATLTRFRVSASAAGLTVRGVLGWPRVRIPLAQMAHVEVRELNGLAEFGGWGWRVMPHVTGVILRNGTGIWVDRREGRSFAVTVDDAQTAVGVLEALLAREPGVGEPGAVEPGGGVA